MEKKNKVFAILIITSFVFCCLCYSISFIEVYNDSVYCHNIESAIDECDKRVNFKFESMIIIRNMTIEEARILSNSTEFFCLFQVATYSVAVDKTNTTIELSIELIEVQVPLMNSSNYQFNISKFEIVSYNLSSSEILFNNSGKYEVLDYIHLNHFLLDTGEILFRFTYRTAIFKDFFYIKRYFWE